MTDDLGAGFLFAGQQRTSSLVVKFRHVLKNRYQYLSKLGVAV